MTDKEHSTLPRRAKGPIASPPALTGKLKAVADAVATWPDVEATVHWRFDEPVPALFVGFLGHITAVVAATVIATSDVKDADAGLATGLVTTSQRVAVTVGIPVLSAVMVMQADLLAGIHLALAADVLLTLIVVGMIWARLK